MPIPITRIYVGTCARDFHLARLCVASIRYWYPDIPITLIPDFQLGPLDYRPLLRDWRVDLFPTPVRRFGFGMSKLELLFLPRGDRFLFLDADIVLLGPLLDLLNAAPGHFVVQPRVKSPAEMALYNYDLTSLARFDPGFVPPPHVFNSGQWVGTPGLLQRGDFDQLVEWTEPRRVRHSATFKCGEQGLLNYALFQAEAAGRLTIGLQEFAVLRRRETTPITVADLQHRTSPPLLYHWAGYKAPTLAAMERPDFLHFYARFERRRISWRSRLAYARHEWSREKIRASFSRWRLRISQWLAGTPFVFGGEAWELPTDDLHGFHEIEQAHDKTWCWSEPEASIALPFKPGRYHARMETGSPFPMTTLVENHLRLQLNDRDLAPDRLHLVDGVIEFDLEPADLQPTPPQILRLRIDRLSTGPGESRALGLPLSALRVYRRGRFR